VGYQSEDYLGERKLSALLNGPDDEANHEAVEGHYEPWTEAEEEAGEEHEKGHHRVVGEYLDEVLKAGVGYRSYLLGKPFNGLHRGIGVSNGKSVAEKRCREEND